MPADQSPPSTATPVSATLTPTGSVSGSVILKARWDDDGRGAP